MVNIPRSNLYRIPTILIFVVYNRRPKNFNNISSFIFFCFGY